MFECVVCGLCTKDARVYATSDHRAPVVAVCGPYCRRVFKRESWKFLPADAETGDGD